MEFRVVLALSIIVMAAGEAFWTEWTPLCPCTAKPCNCHPTRKRDDCETGKMIEIRFCNRTMDDNPCEYEDGTGPIRLNKKCTNDNKACPGWSEWKTFPKYECKCEDERKHTVLKVRECNNPAPVFDDVRCFEKKNAGGEGTLTGIIQEEPMIDKEHCPCIATTVITTKPTTVTTTEGPDCDIYDYGTTRDPECDYIYQSED